MPPANPFVQLTEEFNTGRLRAIICSGQAVVLHRVAMMSKDGDWIVREEEEDLAHLRATLASHGAQYRYGAPLDGRWLAGGWSAHLEFRREDGLRVRTDFFSRPPRLSPKQLDTLWQEQTGRGIPFVGLRELALMKMTQREKDYPIIGELARRMADLGEQLRFSRSPRDLIRLADEHPAETEGTAKTRPLLQWALAGKRERLAEELDAERRQLMEEDALRLAQYQRAGCRWAEAWPKVEASIRNLPLVEAHAMMTAAAQENLPFHP